MLELTNEYRDRVFAAIRQQAAEAKEMGTSYAAWATRNGINKGILSRILDGEKYVADSATGEPRVNKDGGLTWLLSDAKIIEASHQLKVETAETKWVAVRNTVFASIESDMQYCKNNSEVRSIADDCGIGKTFSARYICRSQPNSLYIDCKQARTPTLLVKALAQAIGIDNAGTLQKVKGKVITALCSVIKPLVVLDDVGYMDNKCIREILELMDATEGACGWYLIGDDSLQEKIDRAINGKQIGFRALFSRLGKKYTRVVPIEKNEKHAFYSHLLRGVIEANYTGTVPIDELLKTCLKSDHADVIGDLRRARGAIRVFG